MTVRSRGARVLVVLVGAVAAAGLVLPAAGAPAPGGSGPGASAAGDTAALAAQLRHGGLGAAHGVKRVCADAGLACDAEALSAAKGSAALLSTGAPLGYGASELAAAYHLQGKGGGTIAIIDAGAYPTLEADLAVYRKQYGLPECSTANGCFRQMDSRGGPPLPPATDIEGKAEEETIALETALDMDMASAACPDCKLVEVQVPLADGYITQDDPHAHKSAVDFGTATRTAVAKGAAAVGISYGLPSDATNDTGPAGRALFQSGTAVVAASGDRGFNDPDLPIDQNVTFGAPWPQNLPWVVSAGGTSLFAPTPTRPDYTETAWSGAGSGCDPLGDPAIGQPAAVSAQCHGHRAGSDVSTVADPATGVAVYDAYAPASGQPQKWITVGGTSAAAPLVAGMYARAGHTAGVTGPNTLYRHPASAFTDITTGQNAVRGTCEQAGVAQQICDAGPGWDGPTGLGSPNGLTPFQ